MIISDGIREGESGKVNTEKVSTWNGLTLCAAVRNSIPAHGWQIQNPQVLPVLHDLEAFAQDETLPPLMTGAANVEIFFFTPTRLHSGQTRS